MQSPMGECHVGGNYDKEYIKQMVTVEANRIGIPSTIALAVVHVESAFNPRAIGPVGELGLFQLRVKRFEAKYFRIDINIREGLRRLNYWKYHCPLQNGFEYVICYNQGGRQPKHPKLHPYYKKIVKAMHEQI